MLMKLRRKTKSGLSMNDRRWIKKKIEAKLSVETLERRELLAADIVGGLADVAEGEGDPKVQMRLVATDLQGQPVDTVFLIWAAMSSMFSYWSSSGNANEGRIGGSTESVTTRRRNRCTLAGMAVAVRH